MGEEVCAIVGRELAERVGGAALRLKKVGATLTPDYVHFDHQGSALAATNASGAVLWRERYSPWGTRLLKPAGNRGDTGYTGHLMDNTTELVYIQARYYDSQIGRFYSTDPIGYQDQLNLYAYVHNDPVNKVDPNGEQSENIMDQRNAALASFAKDNPRVALAATALIATAGAASFVGPAVVANLSAAGAAPELAALGGVTAQSTVAAGGVQAAVDLGNTGAVDAGNVAKAAAIGAFGGGLVGAIPKVGIGSALARTEVGATVGAVSAIVMNGSETTGTDVLAGAAGGAIGVHSDAVGAAATITTEVFKDDDIKE